MRTVENHLSFQLKFVGLISFYTYDLVNNHNRYSTAVFSH